MSGRTTGATHLVPTRPWTPAEAASVPLPGDLRPDPRLAFALHTAELVNHYAEIWRHLSPGDFLVVAASEHEEDNRRIVGFAADNGYEVAWVGDLLAEGRVFRAVVSNHVGSAGFHPSIGAVVTRLGDRQVRLMYSLGKDAANYVAWNEEYDLILCWGPYHAERLAAYRRPRVVQVGYPRLDPFFRITEDRRRAVERFGGDPDRPTIAWLPTWHDASSIDAFAETMAGLRTHMNVLVKVHPLTVTGEPARMARLKSFGLAPTGDWLANNLGLIHAADIVAADYGGSAFAAIYADRELVLLNTPGVGSDPADRIVGSQSLDLQLREWILNIDPGEGAQIAQHLADPAARDQQALVREQLRRSLFAPFRGCAGEVAATVLRNLDAVLG